MHPQLAAVSGQKNNLVRTYPLEGAQNVQVIDLGKRLQLVLHGQNPTLTPDDWLAARVPVATQSPDRCPACGRRAAIAGGIRADAGSF
jgi:hypothetical protein